MAEKTFSRLKAEQDRIFRELTSLQNEFGSIKAQMLNLIGSEKTAHRGYVADKLWMKDPDISKAKRARIKELAAKKEALSNTIAGKYNKIKVLHAAAILAYRREQKLKLHPKKRGRKLK